MAAEALTYAEFKEEVVKRLGGDVPKATVDKVLGAFVAETQDCLVNGYTVAMPGLFKVEPVVKAGRKKGTVIRNPFDKEAAPRTLKADEPDQFAVKFSKSSALKGKFPSLRTNDGKALHAKLTAKPRAARKK